MAAVQNRFLQPQQPAEPRRKRWGGCLGGLSCFRKQNGGKRIVPASRIPEANALSNQPNGPQANAPPNQITGVALSILAPPSSPASFSNSALPSTAQSPNCFFSANSLECPSPNMFVTGPYAHETQLVSPPVFSTFTTEPSTAPFTPPPESAHLTTPSSPEVPYALFLSSSIKVKNAAKANDLQATYSLYPGSPASTLRSPVSDPPRLDPPLKPVRTQSESSRIHGPLPTGASESRRQDSNFFCPETFAQFYLDQSLLSNSGGRLSVSRESDAYGNGGNGYPSRQNKACKPDAEEIEAYRASFGFSADEIITTSNYVEISDVLEESVSITPFTSNKDVGEGHILNSHGAEAETRREFSSTQINKSGLNRVNSVHFGGKVSYSVLEDEVQHKRFGDAGRSFFNNNHNPSDEEDILSKMDSSRIGRKYHFGSSMSDAEIDYRRGLSLREGRRGRES